MNMKKKGDAKAAPGGGGALLPRGFSTTITTVHSCCYGNRNARPFSHSAQEYLGGGVGVGIWKGKSNGGSST